LLTSLYLSWIGNINSGKSSLLSALQGVDVTERIKPVALDYSYIDVFGDDVDGSVVKKKADSLSQYHPYLTFINATFTLNNNTPSPSPSFSSSHLFRYSNHSHPCLANRR
jgi:hypothetical protein